MDWIFNDENIFKKDQYGRPLGMYYKETKNFLITFGKRCDGSAAFLISIKNAAENNYSYSQFKVVKKIGQWTHYLYNHFQHGMGQNIFKIKKFRKKFNHFQDEMGANIFKINRFKKKFKENNTIKEKIFLKKIVYPKRFIPKEKKINIRQLIDLLQNKEVLILTGAGISISKEFPDISSLTKNINNMQDISNILKNPKIFAEKIKNWFALGINTKPTPTHLAIKKLIDQPNYDLWTYNFDLLHENAGTKTFHIVPAGRYCNFNEMVLKYDVILTVGFSEKRPWLSRFKGIKIACNNNIDSIRAPYDYYIINDCHKILPDLAFCINKYISWNSKYLSKYDFKLPKQQDNSFSVMSYNIHGSTSAGFTIQGKKGGNTQNEIQNFIQYVNADIVCLQEVITNRFNHNYQFEYVYQPEADRPYGFLRNMILSKYPILKSKSITLEKRPVILSKIKLPTGKIINITNIHLTPYNLNKTLKQFAKIQKYNCDIITGDFNLTPSDLVIQPKFNIVKHDYNFSCWSNQLVDYFVINNRVQCFNADFLNFYASDHLPLFGQFNLF